MERFFFTSRTLAIPLNRPVCVLLLDLCSHQENWNVRYYSNHTFDTNSRTKDTLKIALITNHTDKTDKSSEMVCSNVLLFVLFICFRFVLSHSLSLFPTLTNDVSAILKFLAQLLDNATFIMNLITKLTLLTDLE